MRVNLVGALCLLVQYVGSVRVRAGIWTLRGCLGVGCLGAKAQEGRWL